MSDTNISMDSLLDADLDSFADLPEFVVPPAGTYNAIIKEISTKAINNKPVVEIKFTIVETVELNDPASTPVTDGCEVSQAFFMDSDFGQGALKKVLANIKEALGTNSLRELIEASAGFEVTMITKTRKDKNDDTKLYFQVVDMFPL